VRRRGAAGRRELFLLLFFFLVSGHGVRHAGTELLGTPCGGFGPLAVAFAVDLDASAVAVPVFFAASPT
jgi:hypothetical protein